MKNEKKTRRWIWLGLPEKEERYLSEQSRKGWHLTGITVNRFHFRRSRPRDDQYRIDFVGKKREMEARLRFYEDAGWEVVVDCKEGFGRRLYLRRPRSDDAVLELYTDTESKIELLRRFKNAWIRDTTLAIITTGLGAVNIARRNLVGVPLMQSPLFWMLTAGTAFAVGRAIWQGVLFYRAIRRIKGDKF
ncbi:MAG: DUF2812 domain-containing protein [Oscillospiraceae bacterium]|nr:DUF2812 domain-containing protein [Oscillospiraceae bacterium]